MSGAELRGWIANEIRQGRRSGLGISGADVRIGCVADGAHVNLFREDGLAIRDNNRLLVVTIASPTLSGNVAMAAPAASIGPAGEAPIVRQVVEDWFRQPGHLLPDQHRPSSRRMEFANGQAAGCVVSLSRNRNRSGANNR